MGIFKGAKRLRDGLKMVSEMQAAQANSPEMKAAMEQAQAMAAQAMAGMPGTLPPAAPPAAEDRITRLTKLGELHASGALTDEEFAAQKARILAEN
ncbi:MAG: SHOCT domain-containing protein [Frankiaceae bacterium]|nr:SHOCT domain-containing protein [Frankiaceae bacterium]MBV9872885.1 SHOCT domain-containing protein [Frankiaceae bacterium]